MKTQIAMLLAAAFCGWFAAVNSTSVQTRAQTSAPLCGKTRAGKSLRDFARWRALEKLAGLSLTEQPEANER